MLRRPVPLLVVATMLLPALATSAQENQETDLAKWKSAPATFAPLKAAERTALLTSQNWGLLFSPEEHEDAELSAVVTILEPARQFGFFGSSWSAWPPRDFGDQGYEAALLVRVGSDSGYRVQLSHKYQDVALVKYPEGGYVRVANCPVKLKHAHAVSVSARGQEIVVQVDGKEKIRYRDTFLPLTRGRAGIGVSSGARVSFDQVSLRSLPANKSTPGTSELLAARFSARPWLGGRIWVFDGDEPILELHSLQDPSCFAKLKPGYKPQLTFDSHWGIENQGAFPDGASRWTEPKVTGGGKNLNVAWSARNVKDRFVTRSTMQIGFDAQRGTYIYDVSSELEVLPGQPFHFRYGFDFEHHTPLDPFRWQYIVVRAEGDKLYHRPVTPVDPGPMYSLYGKGQRVWYGRHLENMQIAPAVEYDIDEQGTRKLTSAVCAAFYDTGICFESETAKPGTKIRVNYRYTGYPAQEAEALFKASNIYPSHTLDPSHHFIFADDWPKITFDKFAPMSKTWIYGRRPFMTGHNQRPTYELVKNLKVGNGYAIKLGPGAYAKAALAIPEKLPAGRHVITALVKADNLHGPGGRIELEATEPKTGKPILQATHYVGNGSSDWKKIAFAFDLARDAGGLSLALGNAGTGNMLVAQVEFSQQPADAVLPLNVAARSNPVPASFAASPAGALADYRMEEGRGLHVFNYGQGPFSMLELANLDWVVDAGRPALKFADNNLKKSVFPIAGSLDLAYFRHPAYAGRQALPVAIAGQHGGGFELKAFTLAARVKPAAEMGKSEHGGNGDILGVGARRIILQLVGQQAPYRLAAALNVNDRFESKTALQADRWYHVALTGAPTADKKWRVRLFLDGKQLHEGITAKLEAPLTIPPSIILGAEIFYLHHNYYRGLIGRTLVFGRALPPEEIAALAAAR